MSLQQPGAPRAVDLAIEAAWVVPVVPHGAVLADHAVVVDAGRIVAVVPRAEVAGRFAPRETVRLGGHALVPGFVNAHTHNAMTLMRGLADDLPLASWLREHVWPAEARVMGAGYVRDGVELAIAEMLRCGTTCCNENYFFPDVQAATYRRAGFRARIGLPIIEFPSAWARTADEYFDKALAVHDEFRGEPLLGTSFAPHAPYTVSDRSFERVRLLSDQLDVPVHLHLHETQAEVDDAVRERGIRPFSRMDSLGLVNDRLIAVHMTAVTAAEIARCAEAGVAVVHCAESNLKLASGCCPVGKLLAAGVPLAIGTDGCASNNDLDMIGEMRTAALLAKVTAQDAAAFDAASVLHAATLGGARALGWSDRIGSIEPGKEADLAALRLDDIETQPVYDVVSSIVYAAGRHQVTDAWIAGERRLHDRIPVGFDLAQLAVTARRWRSRIVS